MGNGSCPRGESLLTYMPAVTGELVLGGSGDWAGRRLVISSAACRGPLSLAIGEGYMARGTGQMAVPSAPWPTPMMPGARYTFGSLK